MSGYTREQQPFDIRDRRAMVSLGPLSANRHCVYDCAFCYVKADYSSFADFPIRWIVEWLNTSQSTSPFDIVYVSGDTDCFAPIRQDQAMSLLGGLNNLNVDCLFTTRVILRANNLRRLEQLTAATRKRQRLMIGCTSVSQYTIPHLEPLPIPKPDARIRQLQRLKDIGVTTVLALRPFLPNVPISDYETILRKSAAATDVVLGGVWYADQAGVLERRVSAGQETTDFPYTTARLPFDDSSKSEWKVYEAQETEAAVRGICEELGLPFFMRSAPAVDFLRQQTGMIKA